jgi:hypothetical protein
MVILFHQIEYPSERNVRKHQSSIDYEYGLYYICSAYLYFFNEWVNHDLHCHGSRLQR